ncbi:hypothetical protein HanRHA438_Chr14g0657121 [Helianthus annuus]|nr:hypothetical protein HanRHA438_Chr14g0657121 [Helianthus annuus]
MQRAGSDSWAVSTLTRGSGRDPAVGPAVHHKRSGRIFTKDRKERENFSGDVIL